MRRVFLSALALGASLLALCACGAGDGDRIASLLTTGLTSQDPRVVCEGSLSPGLLTQIYGSATKCHDVESEPAERISQAQSVEVHRVRIDGAGAKATATVVIHGGSHDGARGELALRRQLAGWRVTDLSVPLLRSQFEASIRRMQSIDASMKACVTLKMRALRDREFKRLAYGADADARTQLDAVAHRCQSLIA
ncbi:MAG: hypothetical protein ACRDMZ_01670, partial [Solirubrobacteraceae bacterium]